MTPEQEAHLRMMAMLPVRTHYQEPDNTPRPNGNFAFPADQRPQIKQRIKQMREAGMGLRAIGMEFGIAPATVMRYLK